MDKLSSEQRSANMRQIRSENTAPELLLRKMLHRLGYRFRVHRKDLPGCPDLVFPSRRKVVFVHGCFWHGHEGCAVANMPKSRSDFWAEKFKRNQVRDAKNNKALKKDGWRVLTVWECETKGVAALMSRLARFLGPAK